MDNQDIINFYLEGNGLAACERKFHISKYLIRKMLVANNIHIRNRSEQCVLENMKRGYKVNHNFFSVLNDINTYYLGFIAADGTVRKDCNNIKIGLQAKDSLWLEEFKQRLACEKPLKYYTTQTGYDVVQLDFSSKQIKQDLAQYSIVPNKTFIGVTMSNIPDQYKLSFIKGFYDGDGSYTGKKVKITSLLPGILEEIQDFVPQKSYLYHTNRNLYSLEFSTIPSLNFLDMIYNIDTPCLRRKYNKYLEERI